MGFYAGRFQGQSRCVQMLMGGGKTTVVGPLLALLLGNGKTLVMQVVPRALLEFSRGVMREKFSALIQKPVYTFKFDRFRGVTKDLHRKLLIARRDRAVVCSTPTAVKSFFLKFIEAAHTLDAASAKDGEAKEAEDGDILGFRRIFKEGVFGFFKRKKKVELTEEAKTLLRDQIVTSLRILKMFKEGALLLDEVDLILHPLKSELNWPIGIKLPLDFTMSRTKGNSGLRWHIPFHLLDGLFYAIEGRMTVDLERSRDAVKVLEDVKKVLESGISRNLIQTEPHTVLLSRSFYTRELKGLLCRWMLIFMSTRGLRGISDKDALEYLKNGPARSRPEIVQLIKGKVSDEHVKMMNLSHDWLETFLPFTLAKIDRVKYGLLSKNDLERLLAIDPRIPKIASSSQCPL